MTAPPAGPAEEQSRTRPTAVAITMARDEADMLPRWISYYGRQLGVDNLIVLDDNTVDGSTDDLPCTVHRLPPPPWQTNWAQARRRVANGIADGLLACYDVVIFTDVDEFLVPDPDRHSGLLAYLSARAARHVVAPLGVNVLHNPRLEPPLHADEPVFGQRRFVKFAPGMCKPLIKRIAAEWQAGLHGISAPFEIDRELWLLHLKFYDVDALATVAEHRHGLHEREGRGGSVSAWTQTSAELTSKLLEWTETPAGATVPEFDPDEMDLSEVVGSSAPGRFRVYGGTQLRAMDEQPLRRLPERFHSAL